MVIQWCGGVPTAAKKVVDPGTRAFDVVSECCASGLCVALPNGSDDVEVLVVRLIMGLDPSPAAALEQVTSGARRDLPGEVLGVGRARRLIQGPMELPIGLEPLVVVTQLVHRRRLGREPLHLGVAHVGDRTLEHVLLEADTDIEELVDPVSVKSDDDRPAVRVLSDQSLRLELAQRFPDRHPGDSEMFRESHLVQFNAVFQTAREDRLADDVGDMVGRGSSYDRPPPLEGAQEPVARAQPDFDEASENCMHLVYVPRIPLVNSRGHGMSSPPFTWMT